MGSPSLAILIMVSVDVKQHNKKKWSLRAQELCEIRGGSPGLFVPKKPDGFCGRKASLKTNESNRLSSRPSLTALGGF